jgi:hypothetical protein
MGIMGMEKYDGWDDLFLSIYNIFKTSRNCINCKNYLYLPINCKALSQSKIEGLALVPIPSTTHPPTRRKSKDSSIFQALSQTILCLHKWKTTLNFSKIKDDLNFSKMEDNSIFFKNGR